MKICNKCGINKFLTDFYPHPLTTDGVQQPCKLCKADIYRHKVKKVQEPAILIRINKKRIKVEQILQMLDDINSMANGEESIYLLQEALANYVYVLKGFFRGEETVENVTQASCDEHGCIRCIRCATILTDDNHHGSYQQRYICDACLIHEVKYE